MKVTFMRDAGHVYVDGDCIEDFDMSFMPERVRVIQWDSIKGKGQLEYYANDDGTHDPNGIITSFEEYQSVVDEWYAKDVIRKTPAPITADINKAIAKEKLLNTDYVYLPDVNITNISEFDTYRSTVRNIFFNPVDGEIDWPTEPTPIWE